MLEVVILVDSAREHTRNLHSGVKKLGPAEKWDNSGSVKSSCRTTDEVDGGQSERARVDDQVDNSKVPAGMRSISGCRNGLQAGWDHIYHRRIVQRIESRLYTDTVDTGIWPGGRNAQSVLSGSPRTDG